MVRAIGFPPLKNNNPPSERESGSLKDKSENSQNRFDTGINPD